MRITEELLRKKAEHNEGMLATLEEIALHQLEIERIENFDKLCRHIQILLLQNNLIEKMENLNKLKELTYLNLALNNISVIENIEHCESLEKLDMTCNFIEPKNLLESAFNLKKCAAIRELYLTGNPCTDFKPYREIISAVVDQLVILDGKEILPSERIIAKQNFEANVSQLELMTEELQRKYEQLSPEQRENTYNKEYRKKIYQEAAKEKAKEEESKPKPETKKAPSKFLPSGEMRQCNEGKYEFTLAEYDDPKFTVFTISLPRFMDTSLIATEIHPTFISIMAKDKLTQIRLWEEVMTTPVELKRSSTTGELYIKLQKIRYDEVIARKINTEKEKAKQKSKVPETNTNENQTQNILADDIPDLE
jgi:protein TilB